MENEMQAFIHFMLITKSKFFSRNDFKATIRNLFLNPIDKKTGEMASIYSMNGKDFLFNDDTYENKEKFLTEKKHNITDYSSFKISSFYVPLLLPVGGKLISNFMSSDASGDLSMTFIDKNKILEDIANSNNMEIEDFFTAIEKIVLKYNEKVTKYRDVSDKEKIAIDRLIYKTIKDIYKCDEILYISKFIEEEGDLLFKVHLIHN